MTGPTEDLVSRPTAFGLVRQLLTEGVLEVVTPPPHGNTKPCLRTVIQIDGDVITSIRDVTCYAKLDEHFAEVRKQLDAVRARTEQVLFAFSATTVVAAGFSAFQAWSGFTVDELHSKQFWLSSGAAVATAVMFYARSWLVSRALVLLFRLWQWWQSRK